MCNYFVYKAYITLWPQLMQISMLKVHIYLINIWLTKDTLHFIFFPPKTSRRIRNSCLPPKRQGLSALLYINWLIEWHWTLYIQISYIYRSGFYDASSMKPRHQFKSKHRLFNFLVCLYLFLFISCVLLLYIYINRIAQPRQWTRFQWTQLSGPIQSSFIESSSSSFTCLIYAKNPQTHTDPIKCLHIQHVCEYIS